MSDLQSRFVNALTQTSVLRSWKNVISNESHWVVEADGLVHLYLRPTGEAIIETEIYSVIYSSDEILWDAISDFNAFYMRDGGYRLFVRDERIICVESRVDGEHLLEIGLRKFLQDFVERCSTCACWYVDQLLSTSEAA